MASSACGRDGHIVDALGAEEVNHVGDVGRGEAVELERQAVAARRLLIVEVHLCGARSHTDGQEQGHAERGSVERPFR